MQSLKPCRHACARQCFFLYQHFLCVEFTSPWNFDFERTAFSRRDRIHAINSYDKMILCAMYGGNFFFPAPAPVGKSNIDLARTHFFKAGFEVCQNVHRCCGHFMIDIPVPGIKLRIHLDDQRISPMMPRSSAGINFSSCLPRRKIHARFLAVPVHVRPCRKKPAVENRRERFMIFARGRPMP